MNFEAMGIPIAPPTFQLLSMMLTHSSQRPGVDECLAHPALAFDVDAWYKNPQFIFGIQNQTQNMPQNQSKVVQMPMKQILLPLPIHLAPQPYPYPFPVPFPPNQMIPVLPPGCSNQRCFPQYPKAQRPQFDSGRSTGVPCPRQASCKQIISTQNILRDLLLVSRSRSFLMS